MVVYYYRCVTFFNNLKFALNSCFFPAAFCHILARPYAVPEERNAGFHEVSVKLILVFHNAL